MAPSATSTSLITQRNREDLALSKTLHGTTFNEENHQASFLSKLKQKDREFQPAVVDNYLKNWSEEQPENETEESKAERQSAYKAVANSFYDLATDFYERSILGSNLCLGMTGGGGEQSNVINSNIISEHKSPTICEVAKREGYTSSRIQNGISRARRYARTFGLEKRSDFVKGDFMNMPLDDCSYDACYAIEATVHASTLEGVYGEAYRILKPGGVFGCYEWVMTDLYDPTNPEHLRIVRGLEVGNGVAKMMTRKDCLKALETVGFAIEKHQDMGATEDEIKWYYPLEGDIRRANAFWDYLTVLRTTTAGRAATTYMVKALETLGLAAPGSTKVSTILQTAADSVLEGALLGIFTPMYFFVARKPLDV
ncbi:hypothetical protein BGZ83_001756 [Gryganskiella cystojenkinii]|nr:hypothetical protein BGZ83_001756 [Gryganskiella cystojenkinii]